MKSVFIVESCVPDTCRDCVLSSLLTSMFVCLFVCLSLFGSQFQCLAFYGFHVVLVVFLELRCLYV